jgi:hypothetical protein
VTRARRASRRALTATAAVIALAAAAAAVVTARGGHVSGSSPQERGTAVPSSAAPASAAPPAAPGLPQVSFAGVRWTSYHGVRLPSSPSAGPRDTSGGLASGYSDTPLGALLAALNIAVRANAQWGPGIFGPTIRGQVTGPDAAALLAGCQSAYSQQAQTAHVTGDAPLGDAFVTEEAFQWVDWTPADATVDLVSAGPGSGGTTVRASTQVQVTWDGGDWKVIAPPGGDWGNSAALLTSLDGYTVFPGQG